ncbi:MAG: MFS transporter [Chloroflexi bacterium]|nr:MFS transporter [Chloroflexota bacterium]
MSHQSSNPSWFHRQPTLLPGRPVSAAHLYRFRAVAGGFFTFVTFGMYALYVVRDVGLTPFQLLLAGLVLEASVVIFEIPTGILADAVSRRLSVIVGTFITGIGWAVMGFFPSFEGILLGECLWGFGYTFMSGAVDAWLADEIGEDEAARIYPQAAQWRQVAVIAGVLSSILIGLLDLRLPFIVGGVGQILLAGIYACSMTEANWRPAARDGASPLAGLRRIAVEAFVEGRRKPIVRAAVGVALLYGAAEEVFYRLSAFHLFSDIGVPNGLNEVAVFGGIALSGHVGALAVITLGRRITADGSSRSAARVLGALYLMCVAGPLAIVLSQDFGVAAVLVSVTLAVMASEPPFFTMWVNRGLDSRTRATILSGVGQANSLGQVCAALVFGVIASVVGVPLALTLGALIVLPAIAMVRTKPAPEASLHTPL